MDAERYAMKYCKNPNSRYKYFSNGDCTILYLNASKRVICQMM
ncbi:amidase domain-containing protein [Bacillota bacterium Meth-B3]